MDASSQMYRETYERLSPKLRPYIRYNKNSTLLLNAGLLWFVFAPLLIIFLCGLLSCKISPLIFLIIWSAGYFLSFGLSTYFDKKASKCNVGPEEEVFFYTYEALKNLKMYQENKLDIYLKKTYKSLLKIRDRVNTWSAGNLLHLKVLQEDIEKLKENVSCLPYLYKKGMLEELQYIFSIFLSHLLASDIDFIKKINEKIGGICHFPLYKTKTYVIPLDVLLILVIFIIIVGTGLIISATWQQIYMASVIYIAACIVYIANKIKLKK